MALNVSAEISDTLRYAATKRTEAGEALLRTAITSTYSVLRQQAIIAATAQFSAALALQPPLDTLVYVYVPPGEFTMGSSLTDLMRAGITDTLTYSNERPPHTVRLDGFWILRTEVTNAQYKRCVEAKGCEQPNNGRWDKAQFAKQPVFDVNWQQARDYARWVGGRLPTEAEWEKACRGPDSRIYPWGNEAPTVERLNYSRSGLSTSTDVGSYAPGANGLYDMAGNVFEWTSSLAKAYPYEATDGREDPKIWGYRMLRGGSFNSYLGTPVVRCAARNFSGPVGRTYGTGFRVVSPGFCPALALPLCASN